MIFDACEQTSFAQLAWELAGTTFGRRIFQIVIAPFALAMMIGDEQFTVAIDRKSRDVERRVGEQFVPDDLRTIVPNRPNTARGMIPIDVCPSQLRQLRSVINNAARQRPGFAVM